MLDNIITHTSLGFCWWDIPTLLVLIVMIVVFIVHRHNMKKREDDFEEMLSDKMAESTMEATNMAHASAAKAQ